MHAAPPQRSRLLSFRVLLWIAAAPLAAYVASVLILLALEDRFVFHPAVAPKRWMVERTFAWLVHHRRLRVDYEATIPASTTFIHIAMLHLTLRRRARLTR